MSATLLGLLLTGASFGVHLEEAVDVATESAVEVAEALGRALEHRTHKTRYLDDPSWPPCSGDATCLAGVRARSNTDDIFLLQVYGGPIKLRVVVERPGPTPRKAEITLPRDHEAWPPLLAAAAETLVPEGLATPLALTPPPPAEPEPRFGPLPWIGLAAGAVAAGAGIAFGASSLSTKNQIEAGVLTEQEYLPLSDRLRGQALAANVLYGASAAVLAAGVILLILR